MPSLLLHDLCHGWSSSGQLPAGKGQFSFQSQRKTMPKNAQTTAQLHSSHRLVMPKILQARLQQYVNHELPDVQLDLEKLEEPEMKLPTSIQSSQKQESSRKNICFCFIDYAKAFDCVDHNKLDNSKVMEIPDHLTCLLRNLCAN